MKYNEYLDVLNRLQRHHAIFSEFWRVGVLIYEPAITTASISFSRDGQGVHFSVNPTFWASLSLDTKAFVLAHECLHVYFEHGRRSLAMKNRQLFNIAADLVVNHFLVNYFGFKREQLDFPTIKNPTGGPSSDILCWVDTIFPDENVSDRESMDYYYSLLIDPTHSGPDIDSLDEHSQLCEQSNSSGESGPGSTKAVEKLLDKIIDGLSIEDTNTLEDMLKATSESGSLPGTAAGNLTRKLILKRTPKKKKWETVITDTLGRYLGKEDIVPVEQWVSRNRRFQMLSEDLLLPSEVEQEIKIYDRLDVWFFQDTSGSCSHHADRFFKAAASIPEDKFRIRMFCFDTRVYETSLVSGRLYGFGGTCFAAIEHSIQETIKAEEKKKTQYPQVVFVITDGYGTTVNPEYPDRWHWFLSVNYTRCIPGASKKYMLADFE